MEAKLTVEVDVLLCQGTGFCESIAPRHFRVGERGFAVISDAAIAGSDREDVLEAESVCPTSAITVTITDEQ